jgi:hypothetical protein
MSNFHNPGDWMHTKTHRPPFGWALIVVMIIAAMLPVDQIAGAERVLFSEDGLVEDASAVAYAFAAALAAYALYTGAGEDKAVLLGISLLSLICFLDEISWGARIFELQPPEMRGGIAFDGMHDVIMLIERWLEAQGADSQLLLLIAAAGGFAVMSFRCRARMAALIAWFNATASRHYLGISLLLLIFAVLLDLLHGGVLTRLEELAELFAAVSMALAGFPGRHARSTVRPFSFKRDGVAATRPSILSWPARSRGKASQPMPRTSGYGSSPSDAPVHARPHSE